MHASSTSLSAALIKYYKKLLLKFHTTHLEDSSAVDAIGQFDLNLVLRSKFDQARLRSDISLNRAFSRLYTALVELDGRALWQASKQRARQRFYEALGNDYLGATPAHEDPVDSTQPATSNPELHEIFGQDGYLRTSIIYVLAQASRSFMHNLNSTEVIGGEVMGQALKRAPGQALITVSNHVAAMDDPLVLSTIVPPSYFNRPENIRWTLCASDRCFKYAALVPLFRAAKVLPIQRGGGMAQPGMQAAEERLRSGDWVHIFPEGTRSQGGGKMGSVRKGVGKLVAACDQPPLIVPFVHQGMEDVMPRGKALPSVGKKVRVLVGKPIPVQDLLAKAQQQGWSDDRLHCAVAARVSHHLHTLKGRLASGELGMDADVADPAEADADQQPSVSSLDLYDESDLQWHHRASMWEKAKFRMQHQAWVLPNDAGDIRRYERLGSYQQRLESYAAAKVERLGEKLEVARQKLAAMVDADLVTALPRSASLQDGACSGAHASSSSPFPELQNQPGPLLGHEATSAGSNIQTGGERTAVAATDSAAVAGSTRRSLWEVGWAGSSATAVHPVSGLGAYASWRVERMVQLMAEQQAFAPLGPA